MATTKTTKKPAAKKPAARTLMGRLVDFGARVRRQLPGGKARADKADEAIVTTAEKAPARKAPARKAAARKRRAGKAA